MLQIFILLSILFSVICSIILVKVFKTKRYLIVKPSFWFLLFFHVQIQWSSTIYSMEIFQRLEQPYLFFALTQVLPLLFCFIVQRTYINTAKNIYSKLYQTNKIIPEKDYKFLLSLIFVLSVAIVGIFLLNTPLKKTGLFQIFSGSDALDSTIAREESLKNAPAVVRYTYVFFNKVLAIIAVVIITRGLYRNFKNKQWKSFALKLTLILFIALMSSLSGARSHGIYVLLSSIITILFIVNFEVPILTIVISILVLLFVPVSLQINKFHGNFSLENILFTYNEILLRRSIKVPMETGLTWLDYVQRHGIWGINGISFLKPFTGDNYVNVANYMMNQSSDRLSVDSGLMNTSFIFSYYSYMGYFAFILYPFLFMLLDISLKVTRKLNIRLLLPATVLLCLCCINLVNTEYHTILLSYGYLTGLVFLSIMNKRMSKRSLT
ncbi:MAG: hypothetical protein JWQ85_3462 [Mucilaginibacter sp.]|nr:hypothetical protein [Mucilaginibacter sp.]